MSPITLERAFAGVRRGEFAHAYCLSGPVDLLKDEFVGALADAALDPAARDFNLDVRGAGDLDGEALHTLVETPPMLADRRLVVVRGIEQWRKNGKVWEVLTRYLGHPAPSTVLVLIHSGDEAPDPRATTGATHVEVGPLTPDQAARWLQRRASHIGLGLSPEAAQHLLAAVGNDLGTLAQELAKLAAALPEGAPVAAADVAALVGVRRGETVADWVQAILRRDQQGAIALLEVVLRQGNWSSVSNLPSGHAGGSCSSFDLISNTSITSRRRDWPSR